MNINLNRPLSRRAVLKGLGATIALPFLEAMRQFALEVGPRDAVFIHVTLVPFLKAAGELKGNDPKLTRDPSWLKYRSDGESIFQDPDGYPAITPPWGTLNAIDLNATLAPHQKTRFALLKTG